jgi:hypothetical protein
MGPPNDESAMMSTHVKRRDLFLYGSLAAGLVGALLVLGVFLPRWLSIPPEDGTTPQTAAEEVRKIRARLFYVAEDGMRLAPVEHEVLYGEGALEQAKRIIEAQLGAAGAPLASAIPPGTKLRTIFLAQGGTAYVDLSQEIITAHPGGTTNEILTVYTLVNALTVNLPAITGVQLLIDGREIDSLAGHLDLRRPFGQDLQWVM